MGHKIGSHSHSHPHPFHMLTKEEIFDEINTSKIILKEIINSPVNIFSVPGGEINKKTLKILSDPFLDLDEVYISTPYQGRISSINLSKTKFYGRLCIDAKMNPNAVQKHIQGNAFKKLLKKHKPTQQPPSNKESFTTCERPWRPTGLRADDNRVGLRGSN